MAVSNAIESVSDGESFVTAAPSVVDAFADTFQFSNQCAADPRSQLP